jgi:hypothetical protein
MARPTRQKTRSVESGEPLLSAANYKLLALALALLALGYGGMYIENEFKGVYSLYVAPILLVAGYLTVALGIMKRFPKSADPA